MLLISKDGQRSKVHEILGRTVLSSDAMDWDENSEEYVTSPNKIYIDGDLTFDQMAEIVDYLRSNEERK